MNKDFISELDRYISFKSISTDPKYKTDIDSLILWLSNYLTKYNFSVRLLKGKDINPVIFADYKLSKTAKTILIYGHYDVQPAEKEDGWRTDPFKLNILNNKLFGRGIVDNKGQNFIHIYTICDLIKRNELKYNIKLLIEGNEETGSVEEIGKLVEKNKVQLQPDIVLVSDGELVSGKPAFDASYRGGFNMTVKYKCSNNNVHSGLFGGAVPNSAYEMTKMISKLYNQNNEVDIKDFYLKVDKIDKETRINNKEIDKMTGNSLLENAGFKSLKTEKDIDFFTQTGSRPTIQITGFKSGYIGEGYSNIVPAETEVRLNIRTVASQDSNQVYSQICTFIKTHTPKHVKYNISVSGIHQAIKLDTSSLNFKIVEKILKNAYKDNVYKLHVGGAIPFIAKIKEIYNIDTIAVGLGNEDCNMHGANENFKIELVEKGLKFSKLFFSSNELK